MRPVGTVLLLAAGMLIGCRAASKLDRHAADIRLLRQLVQYFITELQASLPLTADLLRNAAMQPAFASMQFLKTAAAHAEDHPACWEQALAADPALHDAERAVLETVGQTLGSTVLDGQLSALALCQERLCTLQQDAEQYARKRGNLYRSMGLLTAMFFVILLL